MIDVLNLHATWHEYLHKLAIVVGIGAVFCLTRILSRYPLLCRPLLWASSSSFFVFAIHESLLRIMRKLAYHLIQPESDTTILSLYFVIPLTVISLAMVIFKLMSISVPAFLQIITGGRIASKSQRLP
ncbi:MAG: hypothetical protein J6386_11525 [Candidatus Synoicihabitans palmerolidicus]|nr:hypothetical protein [Candidatus Synoicihabitans palmerolidicus]